MSTIDRRRFIACGAAAASVVALDPTAAFALPVRGQMDPSGRFGSLLNRDEFEQAPHVLDPAILSRFASQAALRSIVQSGTASRYVISGLPPVMKQGTDTSLGFPGSCEADSFGYGLGTYTSSRGFPGFDPSAGPANQISAAWLFAWAQNRQQKTKCEGSKALPYLGFLIATGAPNALQVPYQPNCKYIHGLNLDISSYTGVGKFAIGSYKSLPHLLNGQSTYLKMMKQYINADHPIAFSGLVAEGYHAPSTAMTNGAFAPPSFITGSGHGQLLVGYDDTLGKTGAFLVQNSFGTDWPYLGSDPLLQGRLWWTYESFFASQKYGSIAYSIPHPVKFPRPSGVTSSDPGAPPVRIFEAVRGDNDGESYAVLEIDFDQPVHLNSIRITPPRATSPISGLHRAPIKYGFAHVARSGTFPAGRYAVELDAHTLSADVAQQQPIIYRGHVLIR